MTLSDTLDAWCCGDSSGLDAYEATHPATHVRPDPDYRWAADLVRTYMADIQVKRLPCFPMDLVDLLALADKIEAGPAGGDQGGTHDGNT